MKKTKIVCTMGPSTDAPGVLTAMIDAGMNVARFNFSHGSHDEQLERMQAVRAAAAERRQPIAVLLDTKGPEVRLGMFAAGKVKLEKGARFTLSMQSVDGTAEKAAVNYPGLAGDVSPGDTILLADGLVGLRVCSIEGDEIITEVLNSGEIGNRKRVAVPGRQLNLPAVSEQDVADIEFGCSQGIDYIAASFIQSADNVLEIRRLLERFDAQPLIISKIENLQGVKNIDEIIRVSDGVMVARGDLGVEIPAEDVPLVQKMIIRKCNAAGKPVITATQMLESMTVNPRPTRAEASDVANAILDGTDAVMLSGETASGSYPVEAVQMMAQIAVRTEQDDMSKDGLVAGDAASSTEAISQATVNVARQLAAAAIITPTESGHTARMVGKYRPRAAIVAVTPYPQVVRALQLNWGVQALLSQQQTDSDALVQGAVAAAVEAGAVNAGDLVVITAGLPVGTAGSTNMIRVQTVGKVVLRGTGIGKGYVTGRLCLALNGMNIAGKCKVGDILLCHSLADEHVPLAKDFAGIITVDGGLTSAAAIVGISHSIPVIVGAVGAYGDLQDGQVVTVDAARGLVYLGEVNAR